MKRGKQHFWSMGFFTYICELFAHRCYFVVKRERFNDLWRQQQRTAGWGRGRWSGDDVGGCNRKWHPNPKRHNATVRYECRSIVVVLPFSTSPGDFRPLWGLPLHSHCESMAMSGHEWPRVAPVCNLPPDLPNYTLQGIMWNIYYLQFDSWTPSREQGKGCAPIPEQLDVLLPIMKMTRNPFRDAPDLVCI